MGSEYSELWVRPRDEAARAAMATARLGDVPAGVWTRVWHEPFDSGILGPPECQALYTRERSQYGEAVYLAIYDGAGGEVCGSFLYEHAKDGRIERALVYAPDDDGNLRLVRVEGEPEPWEARLIAQYMESSITRWLDELEAFERPKPSDDEIAQARARWSRFVQGEPYPHVNQDAVAHAVSTEILQPRG